MAVNKSNEDQRMPARMTMPYMFFVQEAPPVENGLDGDKGLSKYRLGGPRLTSNSGKLRFSSGCTV